MSTRPSLPLLMPRNITDAAFVDQSGVMTPDTQKWVRQMPRTLDLKVNTEAAGTKAARIKQAPGDFAQGTIWRETDTNVYYIAEGNSWLYLAGTLLTTSDVLPTNLASADTGLLVYVTDFNHLLRWNGTDWDWGPGEGGSGQIVSFLNPPPGVGWQACDGTTGVSWLHSDGSITFPDMPTIAAIAGTAGFYFRQ